MAAALLSAFCKLPGHQFWPDDVSLLDREKVAANRLLDSAQVTDSYLLLLAHAHAGQLAALDQRIVTSAVVGGDKALHLIA